MYRIVVNDLKRHRMSTVRETHDKNLAEALLAMAQRIILITESDKRWHVTLEIGGDTGS